METMLKKPEVLRDEMGRFDRHGKELSKTSKKGEIKVAGFDSQQQPTKVDGRVHNGRKPGVPNKITRTLKDMILGSLDRVGGEEYLAKLAIENSSAYASLLGKVLPTTLHAAGDATVEKYKITFTRVVVHPDGHKEIDGKVLPAKPPKQVANMGHIDIPETALKQVEEELPDPPPSSSPF